MQSALKCGCEQRGECGCKAVLVNDQSYIVSKKYTVADLKVSLSQCNNIQPTDVIVQADGKMMSDMQPLCGCGKVEAALVQHPITVYVDGIGSNFTLYVNAKTGVYQAKEAIRDSKGYSIDSQLLSINGAQLSNDLNLYDIWSQNGKPPIYLTLLK